MTNNSFLTFLDQAVRSEFETHRRVLSFSEYLSLLTEKPEEQLRASAEYMRDMMDHFGKTPVKDMAEPDAPAHHFRFHVFDRAVYGNAPKLVGHEEVQTEVYERLSAFAKQGTTNKLILLHGPNGSAKSTIVHALMQGMEHYSEQAEGAVYSFNWIFPVENLTRAGLGLHATYAAKSAPLESYAHLKEEQIATRLPSLLRDHPFLLIPVAHRKTFLEEILGKEAAERLWNRMSSYLREGQLEQRSKEIFETLLAMHDGDISAVYRYVQVERFFFSRRYRKGLVTIEPQLHVDADFQQLTLNKGLSALPSYLQTLNLHTLRGDLIDSNRGVIEYADLLKRPIDSFKYLLGACETGSVNIGSTIVFLDQVLLGSSNELQLDAFKEFPDFPSFKARMELIRVPYLLRVSEEKEVYELLLPRIREDKPTAPHVAWSIALWAVLTRLKKPNPSAYPSQLTNVINSLTPLEKAKLYDTCEFPERLTPDERKNLRSHLRALREEYSGIPYYEGRLGASVRELKTLLLEAAQNTDFKALTPLAIFKELEAFTKRVSEYEFLRQEVKDGYHDAAGLIKVVQEAYLDILDHEVRDSMGLYDQKQWEDFIRRYVHHVSHLLKGEKVRNTITGQAEEPDHTLLREFEKIVSAPTAEKDLLRFRQNIISQVGAYSLENKQTPVVYQKVFPEYWSKLEKHFFEGQKSLLKQMQAALMRKDTSSEGGKLALETLKNLQEKYGYPEEAASDLISFLLSRRY